MTPGRWHGSRHQRGPDLVGPAVFTAIVQVVGARVVASDPLPSIGYALLVAGPVALLLRRRARIFTLLVTFAAAIAYCLVVAPVMPVFLAALVALVGAVREGHRLAARLVVFASYLTFVGIGRHLGEVTWGRATVVAAWLLVAYGLAEAFRIQHGQREAMERARAEEERAAAEQERAAAEQQRRQASEERLRIARELHDVLGHHLSLINVQAGVGLHLMDERPDQARAALAAIKQASAEALREVRGVLAALRPQGEAPPRTPAPGLSDVGDLVADAGLPVTLKVDGAERTLPPEVDRAAYRIAQEALTNVRRHAGAGVRATLTLEYGADRLGVRVVDDGPAAGSDGADSGAPAIVAGGGIAGMRERAAALGGTLRAGPRAKGGFEVVAELPVAPDGAA
jgi:signal transduction histidine kinase